MNELKKELEQEKAFVEKVADRIYSDTDDIEESMPEPEWIERMTDIADKYITRFEASYNFANNLADELLASNIQLNDNQKIVVEYLKEKYQETDGKVFLPFWELKNNSVLSWRKEKQLYVAYRKMSCEQQFEVLAAFAQWGLEQEEAE